MPRWADIPLRSLKYLVLSFFAYAVIGMSATCIAEFLNSPYALIVDVRMLYFRRYIGDNAGIRKLIFSKRLGWSRRPELNW
ncbi:MAG TPA: hypothetical protein VN777_12555 [Terriglobales bacterium]|nr:hypothetical protein [Terriglobales bacterium]